MPRNWWEHVSEIRIKLIDIICVAVFHFDSFEVVKFFLLEIAASLTPDIIISRHKIIAAGIIDIVEILLNPTINKIVIDIKTLSANGSNICPKLVVCL